MPAVATKSATSADWQQHLDFLLPRAKSLRVDQIAEAVGVDERTVTRAFEGPATDSSGKIVRPWLLGFSVNAADGQRYTRRIPRDAAILWIAACANYEPTDFLERIGEVLRNRSVPELVLIQGRVAALLKQKQS